MSSLPKVLSLCYLCPSVGPGCLVQKCLRNAATFANAQSDIELRFPLMYGHKEYLLEKYVTLPGAPLHVFGPLLDRVCEPHRSHLVSLRPDESAGRSERTEAFQRQEQYLKDHGHLFLGQNATAMCLTHGQACPVTYRAQAEKEGSSPLTFACAGSMCTPWSAYGQRQGRGLSAGTSIENHVAM